MQRFEVIVPDAMRPHYEALHFAPAVKEGGHLYCSGMLGLGPDGAPIGDPEAQFTQIFESIKDLLSLAGATLGDILEVTSYHVNLGKHLQTFVKVKEQYIPAPYPAWTAVGVNELALPGALVEVKVVARSSE